MENRDVMIEVEDLTKIYGVNRNASNKPQAAVDKISFQVRQGEVLGFLGPNGAGKTTTMKILTSYLAPSSGRAAIAGFDVYDQSLAARRKIGYLPEDTPLYKDMTVIEYLSFIAELRQIPETQRTAKLKRAVEQCGIENRLGSQIGELSKGFRQRVGLAQAILHEPEVLILDEPTSGLDPNQIVEIRNVIKQIGQEKTVIFSTHILGEVQATCSRILIISEGKLVADGTPDELSRRSSGKAEILVEIGGPRGNQTEPVSLLEKVAGVDEVKLISGAGASAQFRIFTQAGADPRGEIARAISGQAGMELLALQQHKASLEDVFRQLTTTSSSSQGAAL